MGQMRGDAQNSVVLFGRDKLYPRAQGTPQGDNLIASIGCSARVGDNQAIAVQKQRGKACGGTTFLRPRKRVGGHQQCGVRQKAP